MIHMSRKNVPWMSVYMMMIFRFTPFHDHLQSNLLTVLIKQFIKYDMICVRLNVVSYTEVLLHFVRIVPLFLIFYWIRLISNYYFCVCTHHKKKIRTFTVYIAKKKIWWIDREAYRNLIARFDKLFFLMNIWLIIWWMSANKSWDKIRKKFR